MKISTDQISNKLFSSKSVDDLKKVTKKLELSTGIWFIDTTFPFPSGYYVILGNPGTGKSWFALWLSRMFYRHNAVTSVYFTLEMSIDSVKSRILQQWSDLTKNQVEAGESVDQAIMDMVKDTIVVDDFYTEDTKFQTPETFKGWIDEYYKLGYRVFHFDHLHELAGANENAANQKVTDSWAKTFQKICKDYKDIWLFVYAQPNGQAANKKILRRTDIAGSKAITQKCDYFLSLNRNIEVDEATGVTIVDSNERNITLYLDKSRYTENVHVGFGIEFSPTGNFIERTNVAK